MKILQRMVTPQIYSTDNSTPPDSNSTSGQIRAFYLPLYFFFCKDWGSALPLIALQYHEVKINIVFNKCCNVIGNSSDLSNCNDSCGCIDYKLLSCDLYCDYIFLDTDERKRFSIKEHEYLIEQVQINENSISSSKVNANIDLKFNHLLKN